MNIISFLDSLRILLLFLKFLLHAALSFCSKFLCLWAYFYTLFHIGGFPPMPGDPLLTVNIYEWATKKQIRDCICVQEFSTLRLHCGLIGKREDIFISRSLPVKVSSVFPEKIPCAPACEFVASILWACFLLSESFCTQLHMAPVFLHWLGWVLTISYNLEINSLRRPSAQFLPENKTLVFLGHSVTTHRLLAYPCLFGFTWCLQVCLRCS